MVDIWSVLDLYRITDVLVLHLTSGFRTVGTFVHEFLWFSHLPETRLDRLFNDKCVCFESDATLGLPMCFCTATICALVICVWMVPLLLLFSSLPDEQILLHTGPRRRSPSAVC